MIDFESEYRSQGLHVAGIDEAGRGSLAGPVVAAAVILNDMNLLDEGINDSKVLSVRKRDLLFDVIANNSIAYNYHMIDNIRIDDINILKATHLAMRNAVVEMKIKPGILLIDGNSYSYKDIPYKTIIDGDAKCLSVAAASIIAKVTRDKWMTEVAHSEFPMYKFDKNKGYGTKEHFEAIRQFGPCKYHRMSFLKKFKSAQIEQSIF